MTFQRYGLSLCVIFVVVSLAIGSTLSRQTSNDTTDPSTNESPVKLALSMPTTQILAGDPVILDVSLKNVSDRPVEILLPEDAESVFEMMVYYDIGRAPAPWTRYGDRMQNPRRLRLSNHPWFSLAPGEVTRWQLQLDRYYDVTMSDLYVVGLQVNNVRINGKFTSLQSNSQWFKIKDEPRVKIIVDSPAK